VLKSTNFRSVLVIAGVLLLVGLGLVLLAIRPGDNSASCVEYFAEMEDPPAEALAWCQAGEYFFWESTLSVNEDFNALNIFHICQGNTDNPEILMIHGYPTSSFDYAVLFTKLSDDFYVCALDTPGYGFSDKPLDGYDYSIFDDAN